MGEVLGEREERVQLLWWEGGIGMNWHVGIEIFASFGWVCEALKKHGRMVWMCLGESQKDKAAELT